MELVISVGRCKMNSCFHAVGLALILVLRAFYGATNTGAEPRPDRCSGILHRDRYGLRLGCGRGEGEDICVIRKKDERKVLAVCALGRYCRIQWARGPLSGSRRMCRDQWHNLGRHTLDRTASATKPAVFFFTRQPVSPIPEDIGARERKLGLLER